MGDVTRLAPGAACAGRGDALTRTGARICHEGPKLDPRSRRAAIWSRLWSAARTEDAPPSRIGAERLVESWLASCHSQSIRGRALVFRLHEERIQIEAHCGLLFNISMLS